MLHILMLFVVVFELIRYQPFKRPKIGATCYSSRKPGYYLFNAYFLIFLITASALCIFSIDHKLPQSRLQTTCTILLTSISFKWVINRYLPTISYLTSLDQYAILSIFYICLLCLFHALVGSNLFPTETKAEMDKWGFYGFACILFVIDTCFLAWFWVAYSKIRKLKKAEKEFCRKFREATLERKEKF